MDHSIAQPESRSSLHLARLLVAALLLFSIGAVLYYRFRRLEDRPPVFVDPLQGLVLAKVQVGPVLAMGQAVPTSQPNGRAAPKPAPVQPYYEFVFTPGKLRQEIMDSTLAKLRQGGVHLAEPPPPTADGYYPPMDMRDKAQLEIMIDLLQRGDCVYYHVDMALVRRVCLARGEDGVASATIWKSQAFGAVPRKEMEAKLRSEVDGRLAAFIQNYRAANRTGAAR